jgi:hypothetical protein
MAARNLLWTASVFSSLQCHSRPSSSFSSRTTNSPRRTATVSFVQILPLAPYLVGGSTLSTTRHVQLILFIVANCADVLGYGSVSRQPPGWNHPSSRSTPADLRFVAIHRIHWLTDRKRRVHLAQQAGREASDTVGLRYRYPSLEG